MRTFLLVVKLLIAAYAVSLLVVLATDYAPGQRPSSPPFVLFVLDTINLFIHEAGHLFARPFGRVVHVLGGSLFQVLLPLALLVVTWRQNVRQVPPVAFWVGESMINVSVYIADAPHKKLRLIAQGLTHDWNWLLSDSLEAAEPLAEIVYGIGMLACSGAVVAFVVFAIQKFRSPVSPSAD